MHTARIHMSQHNTAIALFGSFSVASKKLENLLNESLVDIDGVVVTSNLNIAITNGSLIYGGSRRLLRGLASN